MKTRFDIFRKRPEEDRGRREEFDVEIAPGDTLLDVFHSIQMNHDPAFAYRYCCRGAICGTCAVRINGMAALACKSQALPLAGDGLVTVDPLAGMPVLKDLVVDHAPFWREYERVFPFLEREAGETDDGIVWEEKLDRQSLDQLSRCVDCIKCASCFSDCPKRLEDAGFIGPQASVQLYRFLFDFRDRLREERLRTAGSEAGVGACDNHAVCVKVCPKDVRPLRAINFLRKELEAEGGKGEG